jgi:hypothetical protein
MRLRYLSTLALVTACGGHLKRETVGRGTTAVQARGAVEPVQLGSIALPRGTYELKLRFDVPRAQLVEWTVICAGAMQSGVVGETFDDYRRRRIAQLIAERERERQRVAAVTGALVGAVAPDVHAQAQASSPNASASLDATVSHQAIGDAAGTAIADATVSNVIELPPNDVGAARLETKVAVLTSDDGACSVSAIADDPNVAASYEVVRVRDTNAEARARAAADPRVRARVAIAMQRREQALYARGELVAYLTGECHARGDHRQWLREEPLIVRAALRDYLIALGAHVRPPMPARPPEEPGTPPTDDAIWIGGQWQWTGIEWLWERGAWRESSGPRVRDHRTSSDDNVRDHRHEEVSNVRDHRSEPVVRDHRSEPIVRDHRSESVVRDHRSEPAPESKPVVRDHRDDNDKKSKDKDEDAPKVRDHRH